MRKQKDWLVLFRRAARWYLPPAEAAEVIADYQEIVSGEARTQEELTRDLGSPAQALRTLAEPRHYWMWLAVFAVSSVCILMPGISPTAIGFPLWRLFFSPAVSVSPPVALTPLVIAALGAAAVLVWFRRQGRKEGRLPGAVPVLLGVCLAVTGGALLYLAACIRDLKGFSEMWGTMATWLGPNTSVSRSVYLSNLAVGYGCPFLAAAGVFALVKARMGDRRWAAVYVLAVTAILVSLEVLSLTSTMDIQSSAVGAALRTRMLRCAVITATGLLGTGAALC